jgi:FMN reductase
MRPGSERHDDEVRDDEVRDDEVRVLGIGGSTRPGSSSELALRCALRAAVADGATVRVIASRQLLMPIYDPQSPARSPAAIELIEALRWADGLVVASPGYHGLVSGLIKNALDYVEDLREHQRVYLTDMAVGCVAVAHGWQACVSTLHALRVCVHALRGWPTPLGVAVNATRPAFDATGECVDEAVAGSLATMARQVTRFARLTAAAASPAVAR